jgi:hypothetical protein
MQNNRVLWIGVWLTAMWLSVPQAGAASPPSATLCAEHWPELFHQPLSTPALPQVLEQVWTSHRGQGLFAHFAEEKHVTLLKRPLRASGDLVFLPHRGLYRKLHTPFEQEMVITPEAIFQRSPHGPTETLVLDAIPAAQAFVEAFLSIFSGSWEALRTHFQVFVSTQQQRWHLGLQPREGVMHTIIACIVLAGNPTQVTAFWVQETNGDLTSDQLSAAHLLAPDQWAAYQAYFDWALQTGQ